MALANPNVYGSPSNADLLEPEDKFEFTWKQRMKQIRNNTGSEYVYFDPKFATDIWWHCNEYKCTSLARALRTAKSVTLLSITGFVRREELMPIFDVLRNDHPSIVRLEFHRCYFERSRFVMIADVLKSNDTLQFLDISENFRGGDAGVGEIIDALKRNNSLRFLDISETNISERSIRALASVVRGRSSPLGIATKANSLGYLGIKPLVGLMADGKIADVDISQNNIGRAGFREIGLALSSERFCMTRLALSHNHASPSCVLALTNGLLATKGRLSELHMAGCFIWDPEQCRDSFFSALFKHEYITVIDLSGNQLTDAHVKTIGFMLQGHKRLRALDIRGGVYTNAGVHDVMNALRKNSSLHRLSFFGSSWNPVTHRMEDDAVSITRSGWNDILATVRDANFALKRMDVGGGNEYQGEIEDILRDNAAQMFTYQTVKKLQSGIPTIMWPCALECVSHIKVDYMYNLVKDNAALVLPEPSRRTARNERRSSARLHRLRALARRADQRKRSRPRE